ncbi:MAG TPA: single-stranded DNA-binding protein [Kineosporiaceae bacterium]|nr:single-stranded DNA-binding protein [Kineosporiaceae bacterium]
MNEIQVTLRGNVASEPRHVRFDDGNSLTSFRLASTVRRYDRERQEWVDRGTTYVNVTCRKAMAVNAATSVRKGQPMVVTGKLTERYWSANGRSGQTLEIHAEGLGHDLSYGTAEFARIVRAERRSLTDVSSLPVLAEAALDSDDVLDHHEMAVAIDVVDGTEMVDEGEVPVQRLDLTTTG